jgi:predicted nucleic acid-binding protein
MIILDTNVISALMADSPDDTVHSWLDRTGTVAVCTTAVNVTEIQAGLAILPIGRRRASLELAFERFLEDLTDARVLPLDLTSARLAGLLTAERKARGFNVDIADTLIAGIALANGASVATRNVRHFSDLELEVINPWEQT